MIEFRSVTKRFPDGTTAVEDLSLIVPSGQITVLVGSSGSGKTTVLRMVNRLIDPSSGVVEIDGRDVSKADPVELRRSIGYVLQHAGLLPHRRVLDNIGTVPRLRGVRRSAVREQALQLMDVVGLDRALATRFPRQLSGGQQQRVGVARALAAEPSILLMDEPFAAVDPIVRAELQNELLRLQRDLGKSVLFVTHDIDEALLLGDRIVIFRPHGIIAQEGTPGEILAAPADAFVASFLGVDRGKRSLHLESTAGSVVVVDGRGRPTGVLDRGSGPEPDADAGRPLP